MHHYASIHFVMKIDIVSFLEPLETIKVHGNIQFIVYSLMFPVGNKCIKSRIVSLDLIIFLANQSGFSNSQQKMWYTKMSNSPRKWSKHCVADFRETNTVATFNIVTHNVKGRNINSVLPYFVIDYLFYHEMWCMLIDHCIKSKPWPWFY